MDLSKNKGLSSTLLALSCLLLSSCSINETEYENAIRAPQGYGMDRQRYTCSTGTSMQPEGTDPRLCGPIGGGAQLFSGAQNRSGTQAGSDARSDDAASTSSRYAHKADSDNPLEADFYRVFNDDNLSALIDGALKNNYDINTAWLNLKKAQSDYGLARTALHPTVTAALSSGSRKDLSRSSQSTRSSSGNFGLSYELDLFGRLDAASRSGWESFRASAFDYRAMRLSIIQRTSQYYWSYAFAREALDLAEDQLEASYKRLALIKEKQLQGAADGLEYDQALVNHKNVEQSVYQRSYELTAARNALNTLLGTFADSNIDSAVTEKALQNTVCPSVPVNMPASLLKNRPDLMASEARVRAAFANVDEARASFYPQFNLNAAVATGSAASLGNFLLDPVGTLGAALTFPFFNYNQLSLQKESALVSRDKARLDFANNFITAVQEVSDGLNSLRYQEQMIGSTALEYELAGKNYDRMTERYRYGSAALSEVLDASDTLRSAQSKLLSARRDLLNASMNVMVALGGDGLAGFDGSAIADADDPAAAVAAGKHGAAGNHQAPASAADGAASGSQSMQIVSGAELPYMLLENAGISSDHV